MCLKDLTPDQKFSWIYLDKNSSNAKKKKKKLTEQNKKWKPVLVKVHSLQNFLSTGVSLIIVIFSKQQIIIKARDVKSTLMLKLFILKYFTIVNAWLELNVAKEKK